MLRKAIVATLAIATCVVVVTRAREAHAACAALVSGGAPVTLTKACSPYAVPAATDVQLTGGLTIEPGVVVNFGKDASLSVKKGINANGSTASPITLQLATGQSGTWKGLAVHADTASAPNVLSGVIIDGAGGGIATNVQQAGALFLDGVNPVKVLNLKVTKFTGYAVSSSAPFDPASNDMWLTSSVDTANGVVWLYEPKLLVGMPDVVKVVPGANALIRVANPGTGLVGTLTIASFHLPIVFEKELNVTTASAATKVTIQKNKLLFAAGVKLKVHGVGTKGTTADIVTTDVTFDEAVAGAGWGGIYFSDQFLASDIGGGAIAHAASPSISIDMQGTPTSTIAVAPKIHDVTIGPTGSGPCIVSHSDTNHAQPTTYATANITKSGCAPKVHFTAAGGPTPGDIP